MFPPGPPHPKTQYLRVLTLPTSCLVDDLLLTHFLWSSTSYLLTSSMRCPNPHSYQEVSPHVTHCIHLALVVCRAADRFSVKHSSLVPPVKHNTGMPPEHFSHDKRGYILSEQRCLTWTLISRNLKADLNCAINPFLAAISHFILELYVVFWLTLKIDQKFQS